MSRIGLLPISIPDGVELSVDDKNVVTVKGPKGSVNQAIPENFKVEISDGEVRVIRPDDEKFTKSLHGMYRSLIANMIEGVTEGFSKTLKIEGTGYRASKQGKNLVLNLGFSHPINIPDTDLVKTEVPDEHTIVISGIDKQAVGNFAANVREWRKPEPYKGKGLHFIDEHVRRKEGKTAK